MEMERRGTLRVHNSRFPLLPGAQCRCGGPSPRRHSMVWHAPHFSLLTVSSWTSSYANTWATGGFSYLVVGQEYLIIFKKTVRHIIPCLPKYDPGLPTPLPPPLSSSQHFPLLHFGKSACRWKGTDTQWCNLEKKKKAWLMVIKVIVQTEKRVSMEQGGQRPPFKRLREEIFQIQWPGNAV